MILYNSLIWHSRKLPTSIEWRDMLVINRYDSEIKTHKGDPRQMGESFFDNNDDDDEIIKIKRRRRRNQVRSYKAEHIYAYKSLVQTERNDWHSIPHTKNIKNSAILKNRADPASPYPWWHWATKPLHIAKSAVWSSWKGIYRTINQNPDRLWIKQDQRK